MKDYKMLIIGFFVVNLLGVLFHFLFDLLNQSRYIAVFAPVNESVFEHLKILFYPYLIWSVIEYLLGGKSEYNFIASRIIAVTLGMLFIVTAFYTYTGIIGQHFLIIDLIIFAASIILALICARQLTEGEPLSDNVKIVSFIWLMIVLLSFVIFTFNPPHINFFKDPSTHTYGI